ncbi:MAG: hypothetical protein L7S56_04335 [Candidatus Poseidonia sp.]|nr:hypothetical protein [Poseidonia sp.]
MSQRDQTIAEPTHFTPDEMERTNENPALNGHTHRRWLTVMQVVSLVFVLALATYNHALLSSQPPSVMVQSSDLHVTTEGVASGSICPEGGQRLFIGSDGNGNGILDAFEHSSSTVVCNGPQGLSGPQGQPGDAGELAPQSLVRTEAISPLNETCLAGGIHILSGMDLNFDGTLDINETSADNVLCHGTVGLDGLDGTQGVDGVSGAPGASALIDRVPVPTYLCEDGFVLAFGIDDGAGSGEPHDETLHIDETHDSLNICFSALRSGRLSDVNFGLADSVTNGCDQAGVLPTSQALMFAGNDGTNGCELHLVLPNDQGSNLLADIHSMGDSSPGRFLGFTPLVVEGEDRMLFDADDGGMNGRQLWVSNGTPEGTVALGSVEWQQPVYWMSGVVFQTSSNGLVWTNGTSLHPLLEHPSWSTTIRQEALNQSQGVVSMGQGWLHSGMDELWFSGEDSTGDTETYRLSTNGTWSHWEVNENGDAQFTNLISEHHHLYAVAMRGTAKQVVKLADDGAVTWLTSITPTSGDTYLGEGFGLHIIGDNLVYDAKVSSSDATLWTTNLVNGITVQLSTELMAPGEQLGAHRSGDRLAFDCLTPTRGLEWCVTDATTMGTKVVDDLTPGMGSSDLKAIAPVGDGWVLVSDGRGHGSSLWTLSGDSLQLAYNPWEGIGNSSDAGHYGGLIIGDTQAFVIAHDGETGHEWHRWSHGVLSDDWMIMVHVQ